MSNEYKILRVAQGNVTFPTSIASNATGSAGTGIYVPKGAIVRAVTFLPGGAMTNISNFKDATVNAYIGTVVIGTNNRKASEAIVQTVVGSLGLKGAGGVLVPATGQLIVHWGASDATKTGIVFDMDVYAEYLYCADNDLL